MTPNDYSEDKLIQQSTAEFMEYELGWKSVFAFGKEVLGENGTLGRASEKEVLLRPRFKAALKRLNPWMSEKQLEEALLKMTEHVSSASLMQINEQKYRYIRDGIPVTAYKPNGEQEEKRAIVIDFREDHISENEFLVVRELYVRGTLYRRRADLVGYVNGLPLVFMEVKNHDVDVENAFTDNYSDYLETIPQLFYYNAFCILSNGEDARIGTIGSKWEFFNEWKRLTEDEAGNIELPTMLRGVCDKKNLLDILENFILFDHSDGKHVKILARNHQYLGVNQAVEMYRNRKALQGKMGVFWHTQGSGKSYSMLFLAQKIRRKFEGSPTILVLTDREELNKQISDSFLNCKLLGDVDKTTKFLATSGEDLVDKLKTNASFIFSLIQKFNHPEAAPIYPDHDIIIMSDEAHRTQNGIFAENMMHLLPTACRIGFTGTPLMKDDNITSRTFGGYVSIYDFKRAVEDHATVPLYYENRAEKLKELKNPEINEKIAEALDDAELDEEQKAKVELQFAKEVHLLTAEKRLRIVAKDIVRHYTDTWTSGKAMVVSYNKVTCVRMYNYVQEYWAEQITALKKRIKKATSQQEAQELEHKLKWMEEYHTPMQEHLEAENFEKLSKLKDAANALSETVETRRRFCAIANTLETLWKYLCQEDITEDMFCRKNIIVAIRKELQKKRKHVDVTDISVTINRIINDQLEVSVDTAHDEHPMIDISKINFDVLRREFAKSKRKNLIMRDLESMIQERLARMIATNGNRVNFYEHYQRIIKEYNSEQDRANIEKVFDELMALSAQMDEEEKRYVREGFENDEQLAVYDMLFKDSLSKEDIKTVKAVSKELLATIKEKVEQMSQPFEKITTKAEIQQTILAMLWKELPPSYPEENIGFYRDKIYEYVSTIYSAYHCA